MKKIACVGYHATGAGVIDDLFREFDNVAQGKYEVESRLLQDPDGISDLEYNLIENPHRLNSGFAIKRYKQYVERTERSYKKIFGKEWKRISYSYIQSLVKIEYKGYWHGDIWLLNPVLRYYYYAQRAWSKIAPPIFRKPSYYNYFPWLTSFHVDLTREDFLLKTKKYIDDLCKALVGSDSSIDYVVLDQLLSPTNPERYINYVNDIKVIIVDRDPRDLYLHHRLHKDHTLPSTPHEFCITYRDVRPPKQKSDNILYVNFEDMIYKYNSMRSRVLDFVGIEEEHHVYPKKYFNPDISIHGTRQWLRHPEFADDIRIIEKELPEFLYRYESI